MSNHLDTYGQIKKEIAKLEAELDKLKPKVIAEMVEQNADQIVLQGVGIFHLQSRRTWEYPQEVKDSEAQYKELKENAEADGSATYVEKPVLVFKPL